MHRPDTIIEIHRERIQDQTVEMFSGDKYTQSVDGAGYSATATLDLTLDRVWFILDSHERLWQEETDGESRYPLRHFAIDLVIFDSKIVIDSVTCIPLVSLPPATITIPDGSRAGESREIPYDEIPLFGRLTIHDQLEPHRLEPDKETIALNFGAQDAPVLVATALRDEYAARLFGPHIEHHSEGGTAFTGQDPRISWELHYAEAYWITHSIAGELMVNLEKLQHPSLSDDEARTRVLDSLAAQIADAVRPKLAEMGDNGIVELLPSPVDVEPEAKDDSTVKALDVVVQRFDVGEATHESMVVQLQTLRALPSGEELPASILAENLCEKTGLAVTGRSILGQVRDTVMKSFGLDEGDFAADAPCLLEGPKTINIGGEDRSLDALDAGPAQNPQEPEVNPDFSLTAAGKVAAAAGAAAVVGLLALPVTWAAGAVGVGAAGAGGLLTLAIVQYVTTVLTIDWFGSGIGSRQVKKSLNDLPEGTSLPPIGIPVDVDLNRQRLAVYFRPLPAKLWVSCVTAEAPGPGR